MFYINFPYCSSYIYLYTFILGYRRPPERGIVLDNLLQDLSYTCKSTRASSRIYNPPMHLFDCHCYLIKLHMNKAFSDPPNVQKKIYAPPQAPGPTLPSFTPDLESLPLNHCTSAFFFLSRFIFCQMQSMSRSASRPPTTVSWQFVNIW